MKKILITLIVFLFLGGCKKDSSEPVIYPTSKICFLGDSITRQGDWANATNNSNCINMGIGGNTTIDVKNRLNDVIELNPCKIFIMIGINDLNRNFNVDDISQNLYDILTFLEKHLPKTQIILQSVLPIGGKDAEARALPSMVIELNEKYKKLALTISNTIYINLHDYFLNDNGLLNMDLYDGDGLHLSKKGYSLWISIIKPLL